MEITRKCKYCGGFAYKTNGNADWICKGMAETGVCGSGLPVAPLPRRNKPCPCGSKKNYKNCCGKQKK